MTVHLTVIPGGRDDTWQDRGACRGSSQDHWFPAEHESNKEAKKICNGCPVRNECLEHALTHHERYGIWGGTTTRERERIRRQRKLDTAPPDDGKWRPKVWDGAPASELGDGA